jgi:hypothetical protein
MEPKSSTLTYAAYQSSEFTVTNQDGERESDAFDQGWLRKERPYAASAKGLRQKMAS